MDIVRANVYHGLEEVLKRGGLCDEGLEESDKLNELLELSSSEIFDLMFELQDEFGIDITEEEFKKAYGEDGLVEDILDFLERLM